MADVAESLTQKETANRLRITTAWVRELTSRGILSRNPDRTYPWPTVADEYEAFKRGDEGGDAASDYKSELARLTREKADRAEMENRRRRGELVEADDVELMLRASLDRVNAILKNVPSRYGSRLAKDGQIPLADAKALLGEVVEAIRAALRDAPDASSEPETEEDQHAAA